MQYNNKVMKKNLAIEALRGILIIWIVLFHYTVRYFQIYPSTESFPFVFENGGLVGVTCFFVISGYYLFNGIVCEPQSSIRNVGKYFLNKYWRLYPAYLISVVIIYSLVNVYGLSGREITPPNFMINLFFIYHPHATYVDSAHWFISDLTKIYVLASFMLLIRPNLRDMVIIVSEIVLVIIFIGNQYVNIHCIDSFNAVVGTGSFLKVLLGYNLLVIIKKHKYNDIFYSINVVIVLILMIWFCYSISTIWILIYAFIIYMAFKYGNYIPRYCNLLVIVGTYSFTWYLIHQNIGFIVINCLRNKGMLGEFWLLIPIVFTFTLAVVIQKAVAKLPRKLC